MDPLYNHLAGGGIVDRLPSLPQWTPGETRAFLSIRAELDPCFANTKRNKPLWEAISSRMLHRGFSRTPEQCKSKWKNLLTRFKGSEMLEEGKGFKQFPYYEEMRSITSLRKVKEKGGKEQAEQEEEEEEIIRMRNKSRRKKKKVEEEVGEGVADKVEWALGELTRRQREREERWLRESEAREAERSNAENEWRRSMGIVLEERMEMERRWRAREEERRARKEMRAEQRDRLVAAIVAQLDDNGEEGGD